MITLDQFESVVFCEKCDQYHEVPLDRRGRVFGLKCQRCNANNVISQKSSLFFKMPNGGIFGAKFFDGEWIPIVENCHYNGNRFSTSHDAVKFAAKDWAGQLVWKLIDAPISWRGMARVSYIQPYIEELIEEGHLLVAIGRIRVSVIFYQKRVYFAKSHDVLAEYVPEAHTRGRHLSGSYDLRTGELVEVYI